MTTTSMNRTLQNYKTIFREISSLYKNTKNSMLEAYWKTGKYITETEEEYGTGKGYGKGLIDRLSRDLTKKYGKGFSETNIKNMRRFYRVYEKSQPVAEFK